MRSAYNSKGTAREMIRLNDGADVSNTRSTFEYVADMALEMASISKGCGNGFLSDLFRVAADVANHSISRLH